jgi:hypothetical protein
MRRLHSGGAGELCVRPVHICVLSRLAKKHLGKTAVLNFVKGKLNPLRLRRTRLKRTSMYTGKLKCAHAEAPKHLGGLDMRSRR